MIANIFQVGSTEYRVANRMHQHISIRMPKRPCMVIQLHPSQNEWMVFLQLMYIKTKTYFYFHAICFLLFFRLLLAGCLLLFAYRLSMRTAKCKSQTASHQT